MNNKHLAIVSALTVVAGLADQIAGTGLLQALGPWGALAGAALAALSNAYLHSGSAPAAT